VQVDYLQPEMFADVGNRRFSDDKVRAAYLGELRKHLAERASKLLATGQLLRVSITEVDMAGEFESWRPPAGDVRIVNDIYPPRIDLTFRLAGGDGKLIREGARKLRDPAFLLGSNAYPDDPLRYEKRLIDRWLDEELAGR
jgi:hypothetical protein